MARRVTQARADRQARPRDIARGGSAGASAGRCYPRPTPTMPTLTRDTLADSLRRLTSEGGAENRLVAAVGASYLIFHGRAGSPEITIEAATNFYLQGADALTPARTRVLGERGFAERPGRNNAYREVRAADGEALGRVAAESLQIFAAVYGAPEGVEAELELQLGDPDPTANPELVAIDAAVEPRLAGFVCPDDSHLDRRDLPEFAASLAVVLRERGVFGEAAGGPVAGGTWPANQGH